MALNNFKCNNCNIVISELLAFVQNKVNVMDGGSIIRLCNTAFNSEEIAAAKYLLFEFVQTSSCYLNRNGREDQDMEDILFFIKKTDPKYLPVFVAKELQRLPPVTFDHLEATGLRNTRRGNHLSRDMFRASSPVMHDFRNSRSREAVLDSFGGESAIEVPHISADAVGEIKDTTNNYFHIPLYARKHQDTVTQSFWKAWAPTSGESGWKDIEKVREVGTAVSPGLTKHINKLSYAQTAAVGLKVKEKTSECKKVADCKRQTLQSPNLLLNRVRSPNPVQQKLHIIETVHDDSDEWKIVRRKRNKRNKFIRKKRNVDGSAKCKFKAAYIFILFSQ